MKATIYYNPACGTARKTLAILQEHGAEVEIIEYLKTPPTQARLKEIYALAGMTARDGLRIAGTRAEELGLTDPSVSEEAILDAMVADPILIQRPLVVTDKGARLCRPQDVVRDIL